MENVFTLTRRAPEDVSQLNVALLVHRACFPAYGERHRVSIVDDVPRMQ